MEIHFLGVGEACDGRQPNTSILLKTDTEESRGNILLDCGFSTPHRYFSLNPPAEELQVLWISHFHGDHFLGTPLLLLWFWEMKRESPLHIVGPPGIEEAIRNAMIAMATRSSTMVKARLVILSLLHACIRQAVAGFSIRH